MCSQGAPSRRAGRARDIFLSWWNGSACLLQFLASSLALQLVAVTTVPSFADHSGHWRPRCGVARNRQRRHCRPKRSRGTRIGGARIGRSPDRAAVPKQSRLYRVRAARHLRPSDTPLRRVRSNGGLRSQARLREQRLRRLHDVRELARVSERTDLRHDARSMLRMCELWRLHGRQLVRCEPMPEEVHIRSYVHATRPTVRRGGGPVRSVFERRRLRQRPELQCRNVRESGLRPALHDLQRELVTHVRQPR
jgi:hypothetical protein